MDTIVLEAPVVINSVEEFIAAAKTAKANGTNPTWTIPTPELMREILLSDVLDEIYG